MEDTFEVTWNADDGYVGGDRPHNFIIDNSFLDSNMDEKDLRKLFWDEIQQDFEQTVSPYSDQEEEFVEWAKAKIEEMK